MICDVNFNFKQSYHKLTLNTKYNNEHFVPNAMEGN